MKKETTKPAAQENAADTPKQNTKDKSAEKENTEQPAEGGLLEEATPPGGEPISAGRAVSSELLPADLLLYILAQPSPREPYGRPLPPPQYGVCRYCGQVQPVQLMGFKTQAEADEWATAHCECADGRRWNSLQTARSKIECLFADSTEQVREMLIENAELVQDEELQDVTVKLTARVKCKVAKSSKGFLIITRTITDTQQETV